LSCPKKRGAAGALPIMVSAGTNIVAAVIVAAMAKTELPQKA
jgi:hypothetical protein